MVYEKKRNHDTSTSRINGGRGSFFLFSPLFCPYGLSLHSFFKDGDEIDADGGLNFNIDVTVLFPEFAEEIG